jgi:S-adenosylmethionine:tRNA ribosyltransferase-isomerase
MNSKQISIYDFNYDLPEELIAHRPHTQRGTSRMLVYADNNIKHLTFQNLPDELRTNDLLILNNTKVIPARLRARKNTGGRAEILLTGPMSHGEDYQTALAANDSSRWKAIIGGKRIKARETLIIDGTHENMTAYVETKSGMEAIIELQYDGNALGEQLQRLGEMPLPPYMRREADEQDDEDYQTVFAEHEGSVAAPTASLHLTEEILEKIKEKGVEIGKLTLHVGPGTFLPVKTDDPTQHEMHSEQIVIPKALIKDVKQALENKRRIIASGTTALRSLESLAALAIDVAKGETQSEGNQIHRIPQFPYQGENKNPKLEDVITGLGIMEHWEVDVRMESKLMIMPGHPIFLADGLITNYHLPKSTLLLLVAAFVGDEEIWRIYEAAKEKRYRFLSYGDGSLLWRSGGGGGDIF